jgi:hypothetical protein
LKGTASPAARAGNLASAEFASASDFARHGGVKNSLPTDFASGHDFSRAENVLYFGHPERASAREESVFRCLIGRTGTGFPIWQKVVTLVFPPVRIPVTRYLRPA